MKKIFILLMMANLLNGCGTYGVQKKASSHDVDLGNRIRKERELDVSLACKDVYNEKTKKIERLCQKGDCTTEFINGEWQKTCR
jgi:hypothetical protein